jgi:hypothetical protein
VEEEEEEEEEKEEEKAATFTPVAVNYRQAESRCSSLK